MGDAVLSFLVGFFIGAIIQNLIDINIVKKTRIKHMEDLLKDIGYNNPDKKWG